MNRLIINADDFGIHEEVNAGIRQAHEQGVLTSTSLLANGPAYDEAVAISRDCPKLGIAIHLSLVGSLPPVLSPREVPSLVTRDGLLPESYVEVMKRITLGKYNFDEVYRELDAQMAKVMASGLSITHVDSHQHLHVLPPIWAIVQTLMKKYGIHRLRIPREEYTFKLFSADPVRLVGRDGLTFLSQKAMRDVERLGYTTSDYFWGMIDGGNMNERNLRYVISRMPFGVHEIMMHPGRSTDILKHFFAWGYHWSDEFHALTSPAMKQYIADHDIALINYGDLP